MRAIFSSGRDDETISVTAEFFQFTMSDLFAGHQAEHIAYLDRTNECWVLIAQPNQIFSDIIIQP